MKHITLALFVLSTVSAGVCSAQQEQVAFDYPLSISCTPVKAVKMDLLGGVAGKQQNLPAHYFVYFGNGVYGYGNGKDGVSSVVKVKAYQTHGNNALTLIGGGFAFSIALYQDRYFGVLSLSDYESTQLGAETYAFEGPCDIKWR